MKEPVLVIMAAGMGSRYGGQKQIDPIDEQGNLIIDYSIYDAIKAGFRKVVFIIKKQIEADFKEKIGNRIARFVDVEYVYQELDKLPQGFTVPSERVKPWGTGHAILCCKDVVDGPFAVINADDYYGKDAFQIIYDTLISAKDDSKYRYAMVGYILENTLTENGYVSRGVCEVSQDDMLVSIQERTRIEKRNSQVAYSEDGGKTWVALPKGTIVSMNMWGFTESILKELELRFIHFLKTEVVENPIKSEYFLPFVVGELLQEGKATVKVLRTKDKWYGVTYQEDKEAVVNAIRQMKAQGSYPADLWNT